MRVKVGIGQDSHAFSSDRTGKPLSLGGVVFESGLELLGNSDADVVLHAVANAVSGISGQPVIGKVSDAMLFEEGIADSREYLRRALSTLGAYRICHVSICIECQKPIIYPYIDRIRASLATLLSVGIQDVGVTATSGEGLTAFGRGLGIQCFAAATTTADE